jgi:malate synthase
MPVRNESPGVQVLAPLSPTQAEILTPDALSFMAKLQRKFNARRKALLQARRERQKRIDAGERPGFLDETRETRAADWTVSPIPREIIDRRVEITGPVDRKMIINALNSGARVYMADFEDSTTPSWNNLLEGQCNLRDAIRRAIQYSDPGTGKEYKLDDSVAVLFVRPRGWHLEERHILVDGQPMSGSIFDFSLYFYHNAKELIARESAPYFYLPKLESHLEARLWNDIFVLAQNELQIPTGTIKATVLIETILASFEMDEILYELREHSAGLNCGRWDYIFSFIKKFAKDANAVLPDRARVTMTTHFMRNYSLLAIKTCHKRNAHAMGGMSAYIPVKSDPVANEKALAQVRADKEREAGDGHDGTWVAHPGLVQLAKSIFDAHMPGPNQIAKNLPEFHPSSEDLLTVPRGEITEAGVRQNVVIGMHYLEAWFRGIGCVPLFNLMEDAATAEISRAQLWQWVHHRARLADGRQVDLPLVEGVISEELERFKLTADASRLVSIEEAARVMRELVGAGDFIEFLTIPAYEHLLRQQS